MKKIIAALILMSGFQPLAMPADLVVSAAASLTDALNELKPVFESKHPDVKVLCNYGASGSLARQIEGGAPADVFVSASSKQMDRLGSMHLLLAGTRLDLLANEIALVVPKNSRLGLKGFSDLSRTKRIAMGDPGFVPAGQYASQTLSKLDLMNALSSKMVYGEDVRQVLEYVARGEVDAGIVFVTDAGILQGAVEIVAKAPKDTHKPVVYPAAVMKNSGHPEIAKAFIAFLHGPEGRKVFQRYGFMTIGN